MSAGILHGMLAFLFTFGGDYYLQWLSDLISGIGDAIAGAFEELWNMLSDSIWEVYLRWIYVATPWTAAHQLLHPWDF